MKDIVKKLRYILDRKQKINICFLGVMIFIGGLLETVSVSAILPVVWVIIDPVQAQENKYMQMVMQIHTPHITTMVHTYPVLLLVRMIPLPVLLQMHS